ncbi:hypothetical protein OBK30_07035 [Empedobacter falsenii]
MDLHKTKEAIIIFMAHNELKPTKTNYKKLLKETSPIESFTKLCRGDIQLALMEMCETKRSSLSIIREIESLENKRNEYMRKPRSSSGSYSQTLDNYSKKINKLKSQLSKV